MGIFCHMTGGKSEHNIPISVDKVCGQKNYTTLL